MSQSASPPDMQIHPETAWQTAVEIDLQAAAALARASVNAMLCLSALSHREIRDALQQEINALNRKDDQVGRAAANLVRQYMTGQGER